MQTKLSKTIKVALPALFTVIGTKNKEEILTRSVADLLTLFKRAITLVMCNGPDGVGEE